MISPEDMQFIEWLLESPWWMKLICYMEIIIIGGYMIIPTKKPVEFVSKNVTDTISEIIMTMDKGYMESMDHESITFIYPPHSTAMIDECIDIRSAGFPTEISREKGTVKVYMDRQERRQS